MKDCSTSALLTDDKFGAWLASQSGPCVVDCPVQAYLLEETGFRFAVHEGIATLGLTATKLTPRMVAFLEAFYPQMRPLRRRLTWKQATKLWGSCKP